MLTKKRNIANFKWSKRTTLIVIVAILMMIVISHKGSSQEQSLTMGSGEDTVRSEKERSLLEQVHALDLDSLKKGRTTVHYPSGYSEHAINFGRRTEEAFKYFQDSLDVGLKEFHLIMADRKDWEKLSDLPYGMPESRNLGEQDSGRPPSIIIPADAMGVVYEQLRDMEYCITSDHRQRLEKIGLSWEEAARHYVEAITFHEIGHGIISVYEINFPSGWFGEFLTNVFTYSYLFNKERVNARIWDFMTEVTLECYTPKFRTLEDLMLGKIDAYDYHWYQSRFIQRANGLVENNSMDFIHDAKKLFPDDPSGKTLSEKTKAVYTNMESMSEEEAARRFKKINTELISRLEEIAPGFKAWAEGFSDKGKSQ